MYKKRFLFHSFFNHLIGRRTCICTFGLTNSKPTCIGGPGGGSRSTHV